MTLNDTYLHFIHALKGLKLYDSHILQIKMNNFDDCYVIIGVSTFDIFSGQVHRSFLAPDMVL